MQIVLSSVILDFVWVDWYILGDGFCDPIRCRDIAGRVVKINADENIKSRYALSYCLWLTWRLLSLIHIVGTHGSPGYYQRLIGASVLYHHPPKAGKFCQLQEQR